MNNKVLIPLAIIIAGLLIGGAIFLNGRGTITQPTTTLRGDSGNIPINPLSTDDHRRGNPDADLTIVEFSDIDCPFCGDFHATMNELIETRGKDGTVAWVYRHFPLDQLHPNARTKAEASECVASIGGNEAFWPFLDILFEREDERVADLGDIAEEVGVDKIEFENCLAADTFADVVREDSQDARDAGGTGTPHNVFVFKNALTPAVQDALLDEFIRVDLAQRVRFADDGSKISLSGSLNITSLDAIVEVLLNAQAHSVGS